MKEKQDLEAIDIYEETGIDALDFTRRSEEEYYGAVDYTDFLDKDAETIFECLLKEFRPIPFGDYLKRYIYRTAPLSGDFGNIATEEYQNVIKINFEANSTPKSFKATSAKLGALSKNWLTQASVNRSVVFLLGFGLNMSVEDVSSFLLKALQERDFNFKDPIEIIYWYCYKNGYKYPEMMQLKEKYEEMEKRGHGTLYGDRTISLRSTAETIQCDEDLMDFLAEFTIRPGKQPYGVTAKQTFLELYERSKGIIAGYKNNDEAEREKIPANRKVYVSGDINESEVENVLYSGTPMDENGNLMKLSASKLDNFFRAKRLSRHNRKFPK
jgi:hypothetical protein